MLALSLALGVISVVPGILVVSSLVRAGLAALTGGAGRGLTRLQRGLALVGLAVGLRGLVGETFVLFTDGFAQAPPSNTAAQSAANVVPLALPAPSQPGPYTVRPVTGGLNTARKLTCTPHPWTVRPCSKAGQAYGARKRTAVSISVRWRRSRRWMGRTNSAGDGCRWTTSTTWCSTARTIWT